MDRDNFIEARFFRRLMRTPPAKRANGDVQALLMISSL
jgi:hypothetical protein